MVDVNVYCINLKTRDDRYEHARSVLDPLDLDVTYLRVDRHPDDPEQGCFESHIKAISLAYKKGSEFVLVFEDDIQITPSYKDGDLDLVLDSLKSSEYEFLYLGWHALLDETTKRVSSIERPDTNNLALYEVMALGGHAYVMQRSMMARFVDRPYTGIPIDVLYRQEPKTIAVYPALFEQAGLESDLDTCAPRGGFIVQLRRWSHWYVTQINVPFHYVWKTLLVLLIIWIVIKATKRSNK